jgi:Serine dehydrogenase proteinase
VPSWGQLLQELMASAGPDGPDFDELRSKYIRQLSGLTGRAVIVYGSGWLQRVGQPDPNHLVQPGDVHALMECCYQVPERELDLILHSPGGSGTAAEQMINYLRTQFDYIRAIVPLQAKSAATMLALGCDEILMGNHSELGPIDPQIQVPVPGGARFAPAMAILRDFDRAQRDISGNIKALPAWTPILHSYAGGLIEVCKQQIRFSQDVVTGWLQQYMLSHEDAGVAEADRATVAGQIAGYFGSEESYDRFREHGRPIRLEGLSEIPGLRVGRLEDDDTIQDAVLSVYHAFDLTVGARPVSKIVENHRDKRYVKISGQITIQAAPPADPQQPPVLPTPQPPGQRQQGRPNQRPRSERRKHR